MSLNRIHGNRRLNFVTIPRVFELFEFETERATKLDDEDEF